MSSLYDEVSMFYQSDYFSLYEFCKRKIQKRSLFVIYTTFDSLTALRRQLPYLKRMALSHVVLVTFFVDKDVEELATELVAAKKDLFNLRFQNATNQLQNTARIREVRRNIARIQTIITETAAKA